MRSETLWKFCRRGGNARMFLDQLGWKAHGGSWPFVWLARKFKPGSRVNEWAYGVSDRIKALLRDV